jgi:hypothetical protein
MVAGLPKTQDGHVLTVRRNRFFFRRRGANQGLIIALPASAAAAAAPSPQAEIRRNSPTLNGGVDGRDG